MQEITVAVPRYPLFEIFQGIHQLTAEFEQESGIKVHLKRIDSSATALTIASAIRQQPSTLDVWLQPFNHTSYALFAEGLLECLDPYIEAGRLHNPSYNFDDINPAFMQSAHYGGRPYGIPLLFESYILIYNKKLLDQHLGGRLPQTMDELIDAAQRVTNAGGGEVFGAVLRGVQSAGPIDTVASFVYNSADHDIDEWGGNVWFDGAWDRPILCNQATVRGLTQYAHLLRSGPPDAFQINWDRAAKLFEQGQALFFVDATQFTVYFEEAGANVAGHTGYSLLPPVDRGGRSRTGHWELGWLLAKNSMCKDAAWRYIQHMSSSTADERISKYTAGATRHSTWQSTSYSSGLAPELYRVAQESLRNSHSTLVKHRAWDTMASIIMGAVQRISTGEDPHSALQVAMCALSTIAMQEEAKGCA